MQLSIREEIHNIWEKFYSISPYLSVILAIILGGIDIFGFNSYVWNHHHIGYATSWVVSILAIFFGIVSIEKQAHLKDLENKLNLTTNELNRQKIESGEKIRDLEETFNTVLDDSFKLFNSYLKLLLINLDFSYTERISVYKVIDNEFLLIGRASENTKFKSIRRNRYPLSEGLIGKGWEIGYYFIQNLPDPENEFDLYHQKMNEINQIEKEKLRSIRMKSRTYLISRLTGNDGEPNAIIVFESTKADTFNQVEVPQKLQEVKQALIMFVEKNTLHLKNTNLAEELGM